MQNCRALIVASPASNHGKTLITAGLIRYFTRLGLNVAAFKQGPDFIDSSYYGFAGARSVANLDPWMGGLAYCKQQLLEAAQNQDIILIESAMGLFDGQESAADLAKQFNIPILLLIDATAMGETFGVIASGISAFDETVPFFGLAANRVGSAHHAQVIQQICPPHLPMLFQVFRQTALDLPKRYLGLVLADEQLHLNGVLDTIADAIDASSFSPAELPEVTFYSEQLPSLPSLLQGQRIAVARDSAFSFIYGENLQTLKSMGATLVEFSPLCDQSLPQCDAVWLPGGYPQLYAQQLPQNLAIYEALRAFLREGGNALAECGGLMFCCRQITNRDGKTFDGLNMLPGKVRLQSRFKALGWHYWQSKKGQLRGHSFHYADLQTEQKPIDHTIRRRDQERGEAIYQRGGLTATFFHPYFPSNPAAIAALFRGDI